MNGAMADACRRQTRQGRDAIVLLARMRFQRGGSLAETPAAVVAERRMFRCVVQIRTRGSWLVPGGGSSRWTKVGNLA